MADFRPERVAFRPERADFRPERADFRHKRAGGDGWLNGWTDGRTDEQKSPCVQQDFFPFGAAALLPLNLNHTLLKQGTGTADHLLPLACYYTSLPGRVTRSSFLSPDGH